MGVTKRSVRVGVAVGIAMAVARASIVSIADPGTARVEAVDPARPAVGGDAPVGPAVVEDTQVDEVVEEAERLEVDVPEVDAPEAAVGRIDRVVLLGDSLADEASAVIRYLTPHTEMIPRYFGGTAPCDWFDRDLAATETSVVVITFTGNNHRECMLDAAGVPMVDEELVEKYAADVRALIDRATTAGAWVLLVGQPLHAPVLDAEVEIEGLNAAYRHLAETLPRVSFVDAGHHVETSDGRYTDRLPCTEHDPDCAADGTTVVRGDGVHFCPVAHVSPCPVWSSGAVRFGGAIAAAINDPNALE